MKWVLTKDRLPEEGRQVIFDGDEIGVMLASVKMNGKHPCLLVYDSSGEEDYEDIEPYYRWIDESFERVFYIDEVRKMLIQLKNEEISISKFVEVLNEKATGLTALEMFNLSNHSLIPKK